MIEAVLKAFERWDTAKAQLKEIRESYEACSADVADAHGEVRDAAREVCEAMDRWYEWKRMNGPQKPGK